MAYGVPWNWHRFISSLLPQIKHFLRDSGGDSWDFKSGSSLWMNHDISWYIVNLKCGRLDRILLTMNYDIVWHCEVGMIQFTHLSPSQSPSQNRDSLSFHRRSVVPPGNSETKRDEDRDATFSRMCNPDIKQSIKAFKVQKTQAVSHEKHRDP